MKLTPIIFLLSLFLISCLKKSKKSESGRPKTEQENLQTRYRDAELNLMFQNEKIYLLSEIQKIDPDTLHSMLTDYFANYPDYFKYDESSKIIYQKTIQMLSDKYKLSKKKIASMVFSFKYEMLTKEEIKQDALDNIEEISSDQNDDY